MNYNFVIDSSFKPFSFGEMLQPWAMYSSAFEKVEDSYDDLRKRADTFKYLAEQTADDPKARAIYEGYANDLKTQAEDLAKHGLSIANRRALTSLKQRYQGEIGQLERADEQLRELQKGRNALAAAGKTMLYSNENPKLSDFLGDGNGFNRYAIDSADLRSRGAALGKAISSRVYNSEDAGSILQGQYRKWRQTHGIEDTAAFMGSPEVQKLVDQELIANGSASNLSGKNLELARRNILNGIYEGIIYEESVKPVENGEYIDASKRATLAQQADATALNAALYGYKKNSSGQWVPDPTLQNVKGRSGSGSSKSGSGRSGGSGYIAQNKHTIRLQWKGNNPEGRNGEADNDMEDPKILGNDDTSRVGNPVPFDKLPPYMQDKVLDLIGPDGNMDSYTYYYRPYVSGGLWNDQEAALDIEPKDLKRYNAGDSEEEIDTDALPVNQ